jgi:hypothetical protein
MHVSQINKLIDFTMEIAQGCRHNCSGCMVEKEDNQYPTAAEFERLDAMLTSFENAGLEMLNFIIGPTDILSTSNRDQIFDDPRIKAIARRFLKTTLNCAFLDPNPQAYERLAQQVEALIPNGLLKFTVPFEVRHIDNIAYIDKIRSRVAYFESCLKTVSITRVYSVVNFEESIANDTKRGFTLTKDILTRAYHVDLHPTSHSDFILPHGRESLREPHNQQRFLTSLHHLNRLLIEARTAANERGEHFEIVELQLNEGEDWDVVYRNGEVFVPPFIVEAFSSFEPEHRVDGEWSFENIYAQEERGMFESMALAQTNGICENCEFIAKCAERGVQQVMAITNADRCISTAREMRHEFNWERRSA